MTHWLVKIFWENWNQSVNTSYMYSTIWPICSNLAGFQSVETLNASTLHWPFPQIIRSIVGKLVFLSNSVCQNYLFWKWPHHLALPLCLLGWLNDPVRPCSGPRPGTRESSSKTRCKIETSSTSMNALWLNTKPVKPPVMTAGAALLGVTTDPDRLHEIGQVF